MLTIEELVKGVQDLVPLPKAYIRIQELVNDPDSSLDDVTKVIVNDTALTSRILRIANSAYMALASKVDTVPHAVQVLGLNQVHDLALAGAAVGSLTKIKTPTLNIGDFWRRSVYCAVVARIICKQQKLGSPERLFVSGLLHDTGHLLLAYRQPDRYAEMREQSINKKLPMVVVEQNELGFTYADLGAALLNNWQLPQTIIAPVQHHVLGVTKMPDEQRAETTIIHVSAVIARAAMWRSEADEPVPNFDPIALQYNDIDDNLIESIMQEADETVIEAMTLLLPNVPTNLAAPGRRGKRSLIDQPQPLPKILRLFGPGFGKATGCVFDHREFAITRAPRRDFFAGKFTNPCCPARPPAPGLWFARRKPFIRAQTVNIWSSEMRVRAWTGWIDNASDVSGLRQDKRHRSR